MSKRQIIILLGALVIIIALFSGLPNFWNKSLYILAGLAIITVAYNTKPANKNVVAQVAKVEIKKEEPKVEEPEITTAEESEVQPIKNA